MKVGFYKACVTPPIGTPMAGFAARRDVSRGVHDDLYARAIYFSDGASEYIVASVDVAGLDRWIVSRVVELVSRRLGLSEEQISVSATHTHSGPDLHAGFSEPDPELREVTARKIAGAMCAAVENVEELRLHVGRGAVEGVSANRRNPLSGPLDRDVYAVAFKRGIRPAVTITEFACHPVVLRHDNLLISADYPGALNRHVENLTGGFSAFFNGTCGDINPFLPGMILKERYERRPGTFEDVDWMGAVIACESVKQAMLAGPEDEELVYGAERVVLKTMLPKGLEEARERLEDLKKKVEEAKRAGNVDEELRARIELFRARRIIRFSDIYGPGRIETLIRGMALSRKTVLLFLPSEVLSGIGLAIKASSPFENTVVISCSNDYFGYICPSGEYGKGGYEATYPVTVLEKGGGEAVARTSLRLLEKLYSQIG